jgi:formylglycine-generating enzyme required for sulfatase activity
VAWYFSNSSNHTWEVGLKTANNLGIYDMSGNVFEWCWDNYNSSEIDSNTPVTGPASNSSSRFDRRLRGGGWGYNASGCTVSTRGSYYPYVGLNEFCFRLACRGE